MSEFCRDFPQPAERCFGYSGAHQRLVGKYVVIYEHYGRFVGADWCVIDDFGNLIAV